MSAWLECRDLDSFQVFTVKDQIDLAKSGLRARNNVSKITPLRRLRLGEKGTMSGEDVVAVWDIMNECGVTGSRDAGG